MKSVRRSDDSARGNWRCDVCVLSAAVASRGRDVSARRNRGRSRDDADAPPPRCETDTTRRATEVLRK